jgi:hypothetical protein
MREQSSFVNKLVNKIGCTVNKVKRIVRAVALKVAARIAESSGVVGRRGGGGGGEREGWEGGLALADQHTERRQQVLGFRV